MKAKKILPILIAIILALLVLAFSWQDNITFTDEILFEEASYQITQTGNYLIPHQGETVWLEKPPLYFWLTSLIFKLTPPSPLSRRFVTIVAALTTITLTYKLSKKFFDKTTSLWATVILTTTPLFLYFTKNANLDIPLTALMTATILSYIKAKERPKWILLAATTIGLGIMARSFLALTPVLIITIDQLFLSGKKLPLKFIAVASIITIVIALPWHLYAITNHTQTFIDQYLSFNLQKHFIEQTPGHAAISPTQFLFEVLLKFNPLAIFLLTLPLTNKKAIKKGKLFLLWILASLIPLTLATTRHSWYAIQALPPIAILSSAGLVTLIEKLKKNLTLARWELIQTFGFSILLALPTGVFLSIPKETKVVTSLRTFIEKTPEATPLYNLEYQFIPNSTLFNPRQTPTITLSQLEHLENEIYLYLNDQSQFDKVTPTLQKCCKYQSVISHQDAQVLKISPQKKKN